MCHGKIRGPETPGCITVRFGLWDSLVTMWQHLTRTVAILNADTGELHYIARMGVGDVATYPEVDCESAHEMHTHVIELNWEWGRIQVQFAFDSVDDMENLGMGWFLYDIQVQALGEAIQLEAR
mgnify:CR=1 FL=1